MTRISRRQLLSEAPLAAAAMAAIFAAKGSYGAEKKSRNEFVEVQTTKGRLRGRREREVVTFKGVPYAGSVSGVHRFNAPPPLEAWTGAREALSFGPHAWQPKTAFFNFASVMDENCLVLNIWTPEVRSSQRLPVMVYLHGGGFVGGAGEVVDGRNLAHEQDVVVVSVNHRLGLLGHLYLGEVAGEEYATSGNQGIFDLIAALQWIHDNIEAFGGDAHRVMIFGESGGGGKVAAVYTMPAAKGLFHRASIQSAPAIYLTKRTDATATARAVLAKLGIRPDQTYKLADVPAARYLEVQGELAIGAADTSGDSSPVGYFGPVVDGRFVTQHPFDPTAPVASASIPLMVGANHDEAVFFVSNDLSVFSLDERSLRDRLDREYPRRAQRLLQVYRESRPGASPTDLYVAITTAALVWNPTDIMAERKAEQHAAAVYRYIFEYQSEAKVAGTDYPKRAMHAMEVNFEFDTIDPPVFGDDPGHRKERFRAARNMSQMWASFARSGHPAATGQPSWPAFTLDRRATMMIDARCRVVDDPYRAERLVWLEEESGS